MVRTHDFTLQECEVVTSDIETNSYLECMLLDINYNVIGHIWMYNWYDQSDYFDNYWGEYHGT